MRLSRYLGSIQFKILMLVLAGVILFGLSLTTLVRYTSAAKELEVSRVKSEVRLAFRNHISRKKIELAQLQSFQILESRLSPLLSLEPNLQWVGILNERLQILATLADSSSGRLGAALSESRIKLLTLEELLGQNNESVASVSSGSKPNSYPDQLIFMWRLADTNQYGAAIASLPSILDQLAQGQRYKLSASEISSTGWFDIDLQSPTVAIPLKMSLISAGANRLQSSIVVGASTTIFLALFLYAAHLLRTQLQRTKALQDALSIAEERLARRSQLAAIGEVGSRIAHELNQPLFAIEAYASIVDKKIGPQDASVKSIIQKIRDESERASRVIASIRSLGQQPKALNASELGSVSDIVTQLAPLLNVYRKEVDVALSLHITPSAGSLKVDRSTLEQVVVNFFINAVESFRSGQTRSPQIDIFISTDDDGLLSVRFTDNGTGVKAEVAQTVFDPFVTTKSEGTGLGLSICKSLARKNYGDIWFENNSNGIGCTFFLTMRSHA